MKEKRDNKNGEGEIRGLIKRKGRPMSWLSNGTVFNHFKMNSN
jgi:hypothetical protein